MRDAEFIGSMFADMIGGELGLYADSNPGGFGHLGNRARVTRVAEYCAQKYPGDIVEIGVLHGETHWILAEIAEKYGKRTIAVDPFASENPRYVRDGYGKNYRQCFLDNVEDWKDIIDMVEMSSLDPEAIAYLKKRPLCFAYVDGLHTYDACYSDILAVGHCAGIIAVDDIHIADQINDLMMTAFWDGAVKLGRVPMDNSLAREGYLIQGGS